jgi:hypothetical protein
MNDKNSDPSPVDRHGIDADPDDADAGQSVDQLLEQVSRMFGEGSDGWAGIQDAGGGLAKQRAEQARAMKREANIFRDTFMTPAGKKCLAIMREMTLDAAPYPSEALLSIDAITPLVIAHDAQCRFVRAIFQAIAQAENAEAKERN